MKIRNIISAIAITGASLATLTGCQKGDLLNNPNAAGDATAIPASLILNHLTATVIRTTDKPSGEEPWGSAQRLNQYYVSNYSYYWGSNYYNWTNSTQTYDLLRYAVKLEEQAQKQYGNTINVYFAMSKFFRAYSAIWLAQRVGDIPMTDAGNPGNIMPKFDTQKDVYKQSLALLEDANTIIGALISPATANTKVDASGDIFGLTYLQWQKVINSYRLRILISLSKRADDNADLNVKSQFVNILNNPGKYPILSSNADNMAYKYNAAYNVYPLFDGRTPYNNFANIGKTLLDITTNSQDPRTFIFATPAPAQISGGKTAADFSAYVGADINTDQSTLNTNAVNGMYSYINYNRYFTSNAGANCEPAILIGYPELCFNIAEAYNRGWLTGVTSTAFTSASDAYTKGINASLSIYNLTNGQTYTVGNISGATVGTVTINIPQFLANTNVAYKGDNTNGLAQILTQKYVAMFNNPGWEPYYNWRRTGSPAFAEGGSGIGTGNKKIPHRWLYPQDEISYNNANYKASIQSQFGGNDDVNADTWLTKP